MVRFLKSLSLSAVLVFASYAQDAAQSAGRLPDGGSATIVRGNIPYLADPRHDRGPVDPATKIQGASIVFASSPRQQADASSFLQQLQNPASPNYHRWLTPQAYADRFGMTQPDLDRVAAWLRSQKLHVDRVSNSRTQIYFSGTAARMEQALGTPIHRFVLGSETHFSNTAEPSLPAAFAGSVLAVRNLNDFRLKPRKLSLRRAPAAEPRLTADASNHFISPDDLAVIYDVTPLFDAGIRGSVPIAVVGQTEVAPSDVAAFRAASGLPDNAFQSLLVPNSGASTVFAADVLEADMDVEWAGALAKEAPVLYVYTGDGGNLNVIDALVFTIDNNLAPIVSISYGLCEASAGADGRGLFQSAAQQAVMQGQTIVAPTGDLGATDCEGATASSAIHGLAVDVPAAVPEVTGVGGSQFSGDVGTASTYWAASNSASSESALAYIPETTWNESAASIAKGKGFSAGGGGVSAFFAKPSWQAGAGVPADGKRDLPDISLNASADHDGYLVCSQGNCQNGFADANNIVSLVGGTSIGAPIFAGVVGLLNQAAQTGGQGNLNVHLYPLAASTPLAFHDIVTGNNKEPCTAGSTGCTLANSHQVAARRAGWLGAAGAMLLLSLSAFRVPTRRRSWAAYGSVLLVLLAIGVGCSDVTIPISPVPPPGPTVPPETGLFIGYSAHPGYDMATGLGSIDASVLVTNWPGVPAAPSFTVAPDASSLATTANVPGTLNLTVSSTTGFSGTITLACSPVPADPQVSCAVAPASISLDGTTTSGTATLTVQAPLASHTILIQATSGSIAQFARLSLTP